MDGLPLQQLFIEVSEGKRKPSFSEKRSKNEETMNE